MNNNSEVSKNVFIGCIAGVGVLAAMFIAVLFVINVFDTENEVVISTLIGSMAITFLVYLVQLFRMQKKSLAIGLILGVGIPVLWVAWFLSQL